VSAASSTAVLTLFNISCHLPGTAFTELPGCMIAPGLPTNYYTPFFRWRKDLATRPAG